jgi:hypothetical protein
MYVNCRKIKTLNRRLALARVPAVDILVLLNTYKNYETKFVDSRRAKMCLPVEFHDYKFLGFPFLS